MRGDMARKARGQLWMSWCPSAVARWGTDKSRRGSSNGPWSPFSPCVFPHPTQLSVMKHFPGHCCWNLEMQNKRTKKGWCQNSAVCACHLWVFSDFASNLPSRGDWHYFHMQSFPYPGSLLWLPEIEYQGRQASPEIRSIQGEPSLWLPTPWDLGSICSQWWIGLVTRCLEEASTWWEAGRAVQLRFHHPQQPNMGNLQRPCVSSWRVLNFSPAFQHPAQPGSTLLTQLVFNLSSTSHHESGCPVGLILKIFIFHRIFQVSWLSSFLISCGAYDALILTLPKLTLVSYTSFVSPKSFKNAVRSESLHTSSLEALSW